MPHPSDKPTIRHQPLGPLLQQQLMHSQAITLQPQQVHSEGMLAPLPLPVLLEEEGQPTQHQCSVVAIQQVPLVTLLQLLEAIRTQPLLLVPLEEEDQPIPLQCSGEATPLQHLVEILVDQCSEDLIQLGCLEVEDLIPLQCSVEAIPLQLSVGTAQDQCLEDLIQLRRLEEVKAQDLPLDKLIPMLQLVKI